MHGQVRDIVRVPLSLLTRLRLILFGHEDLAGIVFWSALIGVTGALCSVAFREGIRLLELLFTGQTQGLVHGAAGLAWWHRAIVPVVGGLLAGLVLHFLGRALSSAHAVDYMEAVLVGDGRIRFRATLVNALSSLFTIGSGGSIGREGAMVQLAAMMGSRLGLLAHAPIPRLRLMVACGGAAGIAAAYNAPISGALFVAEIILGSIAMESFGPLVVASVTSSATIHQLLGYGPVYDVPQVQFVSNYELIFYVVLGVILGHLAPPFLAILDLARAAFARLRLPLYWQLAAGGAVVGAISIFVPQVWGNGYSVVGTILRGQLAGLWLLAVLAAKVLATSATVGSRAVGGVFTPTLFIGCALGALYGELLHQALPSFTSVPAAYALIGMGGFLAATTHAPLTSILMLFEMTADYEIVLPLMLACVVAHFTAKVYRRGESIYHASLVPACGHGEDDWRLRTISALVKPVAAVTSPDATLENLLAQLPKRPVSRVYVIEGNKLLAWLDPRELLTRLEKRELTPGTRVGAVAHPVVFALTPELPLSAALEGFLREQAATLPVVSDQWRNALLGEVSRADLLLAIQDRMTYPK
ncbi:MAG: ClcB-like voltage-gated chloride channel protein [Gammaproteobacteria bacterium]|nr:ClcB-like voltage-gated chloride channel protein [Gammaproteobacteria bacterium]MBV8404070.1 ClcB-like voltage-gated chloride channel protein [Gammaproteobacteria bacterium]